jgi:hypothetical protein
MRRLIFAFAIALTHVLLVTGTSDAHAKREPKIMHQAETSMLVTGIIDIAAQGEVIAYAIDKPEELPGVVLDTVARTVPTWKFEPAALPDKAVGRSKMGLLFVATKNENDSHVVALREASFASAESWDVPYFDANDPHNPQYPTKALRRKMVPSTIYLVFRYGRDGRMLDVDVEQVNLHVYGTDIEMRRWRKALADACLRVAHQWRVNVPPAAFRDGRPYRIGRTSVSFSSPDRRAGYGEWKVYLPGPRKFIPWIQDTPASETRPEASLAGDVQGSDVRRLMTPVSGD